MTAAERRDPARESLVKELQAAGAREKDEDGTVGQRVGYVDRRIVLSMEAAVTVSWDTP